MRKLFSLFGLLGIGLLTALSAPGVCTASVDAPKFVVMGSSNAAGTGASIRDSSWVSRYAAYLDDINVSCKVRSLAVGGYTTYHLMPDGFVPPEGRPLPVAGKNITQAIAENPDAIIISLGSNDNKQGFSIREQLDNYAVITGLAAAAGIPVWVTTTKPAALDSIARIKQVEMRDSTFSIYGDKAIDIWTGFSAPDATLLPEFDSGDGTHLNDTGHALVFQRVAAKNILTEIGALDWTLALITATLPSAKESTAYSMPLAAINGTEPYVWDVSGLPAGLAMNGNYIEGAPLDTGSFMLAVSVTDADDSTVSRNLQLKVRPLHIPLPGGADRMEAEAMTLYGYAVENLADASGGKIIKTNATGDARYLFADSAGFYNIRIAYYDESDGKSEYALYINDSLVDSWTADDNLGSKSPEALTRVIRSLNSVQLTAGDEIKITGTQQSGEYGRLDFVQTDPVAVSGVQRMPVVRFNAQHAEACLYNQSGQRVSERGAVPGVYVRFANGSAPVKVLITE